MTTSMDRLFVTGGARLVGSVPNAGPKNSALKLMAASLLAEGESTLRNIPRIVDCFTMIEVLEHLDVRTRWDDGVLRLDTSSAKPRDTPYALVSKMRASILVLGPLLARFGRARVAMPGGCNIGSRKIDLHIRGLERMGARFASEHGVLVAETDGLSGAVVDLDYPSVGATENVLMGAVAARGTTVIENAAREPEIADLATFLTEMGARISGVGTPTIEIEGIDRFSPVDHSVIPDRIEAGTFAIAACATGGRVELEGARADQMDLVFSKLADAVVRVSAAPVRALDIRAGAAMVIAALAADGVTEIDDMSHVDRGYQDFEAKLLALGAEVRREGSLSPALS